MILSVDSSLGTAVAVVGDDGTVHSDHGVAGALGHAEAIGDLLVDALRTAGIRAADITAVAVGMGPGPFTGLRIGIAAARAFAAGRGVEVLGVPSHDAAALAVLDVDPGASFAIVTDARRREWAVSVYRGLAADGTPRRLAGPELRPQAADLAEDPLLDALRLSGPPRIEHIAGISAAGIGRIAALRRAAGTSYDLPEPLYLRVPDVSLPAARKRVG